MHSAPSGTRLLLGKRTAGLLALTDPREQALLERACAGLDTPSPRVVRQLFCRSIEGRMATPWSPADPGAVARRTGKGS
jgi:hypothetical protein